MSESTPGWQDDPTGRHDHRYWDGTQWTEHVADAGIAATDPYDAPAPAPEAPTAAWPVASAEPAAAEPTTTAWSTAPIADLEPEPDPEPEASGPIGWGTAESAEPEAPAEPEPTVTDAPSLAGWAAPSAPADSEPTTVSSTSWDDPTVTAPAASSPTADEVLQAWPVAAGVGSTPPPASTYDTPAAAPAEPAGPGKGGGSKKGLFIGVGLLVIAAVVVAALLFGGDDDDAEPTSLESELATQLQSEAGPGLSEDDARCIAKHVAANADTDDLEGVDLSGDPPADVQEAVVAGLEECDVDLSEVLEEGTDEGDGGSPIDELPDIDDIEDFADLLADQYESTLGLDRERAECLADAMAEAVDSGRLDESEAFGEFFEYLEDCNIDIDDLAGAG